MSVLSSTPLWHILSQAEIAHQADGAGILGVHVSIGHVGGAN